MAGNGVDLSGMSFSQSPGAEDWRKQEEARLSGAVPRQATRDVVNQVVDRMKGDDEGEPEPREALVEMSLGDLLTTQLYSIWLTNVLLMAVIAVLLIKL